MNGYDSKRDQSTPGKLPFGLLVILSVIGLLIGVGLYYVFRPTYTTVTTNDGRTYRVNKHTGETVLLSGAKMIPVKDVQKEPTTRDLSTSELENLSGRGGAEGGYFSGTLYNGNSDICVTKVTVEIFYESGVSRQYKISLLYGSGLSPYSSCSFNESILGGEGKMEGWRIIAAEGKEEK